MPKTAIKYVCSSCGAEHSKWGGRCSECGAWNSLEETAVAAKPSAFSRQPAGQSLKPEPLSQAKAVPTARISTGSGEFDRTLGGGIVPGSVVLVGGEPGIGKSTLLLQVAAAVAKSGEVLYVSGEESGDQLSLRASRLGVDASGLKVLTATRSEDVIATITNQTPALVVIDSIQTQATDQFSSGAGSVTQVRESAARLQAIAKAHGIPVVLVGHVTKEGSLAGPKVLEHVVDVVLYLEGERFQGHRLLRVAKNRFGPTEEVGVFEMDEAGMKDVTNPSGLFVDPATAGAPGTALTTVLEGSRALLVEVQALAVPTSFGYPKRTASGFDLNKLHLLAAVLMRHAGVKVASLDLYLNVSGGYRLQEPAGDLAVALAIAGAATGRTTKPGTVVLGEVGLSGEIRPCRGLAQRLAEAARSGAKSAIVSKRGTPSNSIRGLTVIPVATIAEAIAKGLTKPAKPNNAKA
jgi:DNA repair protein RadA/Sms